MIVKAHTQTDLVKAISEIAAAIPLPRRIQLYEFALFLENHPLPAEETFEQIAEDEAKWEAQFATTSDEKIQALIAAVEADINAGQVESLFDNNGDFLERN
jgi:hypothetical protein